MSKVSLRNSSIGGGRRPPAATIARRPRTSARPEPALVGTPGCTRLVGVRLLRRRSEAPAEGDPVTAADAAAPGRPTGKGRPTPRRREAQRRRTGPAPPPPKTRREAYRRSREQGSDR